MSVSIKSTFTFRCDSCGIEETFTDEELQTHLESAYREGKPGWKAEHGSLVKGGAQHLCPICSERVVTMAKIYYGEKLER
jgi:predicted RNA-binding Zn-ribbon protein involved in translation (DUF1610 family)